MTCNQEMTSERALAVAKELRDACVGHPHAKIPWPHRLLHEGAKAIEQLAALTAPRVPEGWVIRRGNDGAIVAQKHGVGGYAAREDGRSGIAESILYHLCDDMLTTAPAPAEQSNFGASFSRMPPYEYQRQMSTGDARVAAVAAQSPAELTLINEGNMGQVSNSDDISKLRERVNCAATDLDILAAQIAAAGIAGFGNVARDIAARLREGSDE